MPVFIEEGMEYWLTAKGQEIIIKSLNTALQVSRAEKVIVFTNHEAVVRLAKSIGVETCLTDLCDGDRKSEFFFRGTQSSIDYLEKINGRGFDTLCVLNFRNPFISKGFLDDAIEKFSRSDAPVLLSVKEPTDHPCQLSSFYKILDIGIIYFFDERKLIRRYIRNSEDHNYMITRPFFFDWSERGVFQTNHPLYRIRINEQSKIEYIPQKNSKNLGDEMWAPLWIYENHTTARVLINMGRGVKDVLHHYLPEGAEAIGAAFNGNGRQVDALVVDDAGKGRTNLLFHMAHYPRPPHVVKYLCVNNGGTLSNSAEVSMSRNGIIDIPMSQSLEDVSVIIYSILHVAENGSFDIKEFFPALYTLWEVDKITGKRVNTKTGKTINGRQDFPEVFEADGSFVIFDNASISSIDEEVSLGNVEGVLIDEKMSICNMTGFDLFRFRGA